MMHCDNIQNYSVQALIIQFVSGGDLFERITSLNFDLTENVTAYFVKQICEVNIYTKLHIYEYKVRSPTFFRH